MKASLNNLTWLCAIAACLIFPASASFVQAGTTAEFGWKFEYDDADRITKITDPAGRDTRLQYTLRNDKSLRKIVRIQGDGSVRTLEFDERGRRNTITDAAGTISYAYNDLDQLSRVQREDTPVITYTYDTTGRIKSLQVGDFYRIEYTFDFLGRLSSMKTPSGVIEYEYATGQGEVIRKLPNDVWTIMAYEPNGEIRQIRHGRVSNVTEKSINWTAIADYTYKYRPDGLIEAIGEGNNNSQFSAISKYEYDNVGRLVSEARSDGQKHLYEYDLVGNRLKLVSTDRLQQTISYDWAGRITSLNGNTCSHDAAGNLVSVNHGGVAMNYRYNQDGLLIDAGGGKVSYHYNGEGRLIARKSGGLETTFVPDSLARYWKPLVMESKGGGRTLVIWDGATPLILIRNGKPEYLLHDHIGSVRMIVDGQGKTIQRLDYEAFGNISNPEMTMEFAPRFAGMFWDPEAQAYLTLSRTYSPYRGRFLQIDPQHRMPFGSQKDLGAYAYCGSDPVNFRDLDGATPQSSSVIWWNTYWDDVRNHFFDSVRAKNTLAEFSQSHLANARGSGVAAGLTATALDIIGGYIPGKPASENQANAQLAWSLLFAGAGPIISSAGFARDAGSAVINSHEGNIGGAILDLVSMGFHIGDQAAHKALAGFKGYQHEFPFSKAAVDSERRLALLQLVKPANDLNSWGNLAYSEGESVLAMLEFGSGQFLNFIGKNSNWIGSNRSGDNHNGVGFSKLWEKDSKGRFPLGDTKVGTTGIRDEVAKWHDIQDYVNLHADKGTEVKVPWGNGQFKYFVSRGEKSSQHNWEVILPFAFGRKMDISDTPTTSKPVDLDVIKAKYPVAKSPIDDLYKFMNPSRVGGVYLGGASKTLESVGLLDGVAFDSNNNLILAGKAGDEIKLPPLRIDDLVTVFRSVYINGEGPTVTIEPNPKNPKGSAMIIEHSKATDQTYTGWVLYHSDRIMKGYNLGKDNLTTSPINSTVPGYAEVLDAIYFGGGQQGTAKEGGNWERFWIVPAEARRFSGAHSELTLFDVPLKLRTQPMKWQNGKLVDDLTRNPSTGAAEFTKWFSANLDGISQEQFLTPPPESGIMNPVPVFTELRRIALLTAIAEKLRNQGVPMPFWMRDYEVRPVPFERTTPALEPSRSNQRMTARIFGGVSLSPADSDIKIFNQASDLGKLPAEQQAAARKTLDRSVSLSDAVRKEMTAAEPLQVKTFTHQGAAQQAISFPGTETRTLAPCRLDKADLVVPVDGGDGIRLVRSYNSFFNPIGPLGKGWTLDLPRLVVEKIPEKLDGQGHVEYRIVREVITPLNSVHARFSHIAPVPELNGSQLLVPDKAGEFLALANGKPDFVSIPTQKLIRKDGEIWHFSTAGNLVATERNGFQTVYEQNKDGRIERIAGRKGRRIVASIRLSYDTAGRLQKAEGQRETGGAVHEQDKTIMNYEYNANGKLVAVRSSEGLTGYRYNGNQLVAVTYQEPDNKNSAEKIVRRFEYNLQGQLVAEVADNGDRTEYRIARDQTGSTITIATTGSDAKADSVRYDTAFRPLDARFADGSKASWTYPDGGGSKVEMIQADGTTVRFSESSDQRHRTVELDKQRKFIGEYDAAGRLTSLSDNGRLLLRQEWLSDGRLRLASTETCSIHPVYDQDGLVLSALLAPPGEQGKFQHSQETKFDPTGRPREIKDHRGLQVFMDYNDSGTLKTMTSKQNGKNYGFQITHDKSGREQSVESSWGKQHYYYGANGFLNKLEAEQGGQKGFAEWKSGQLHKVRQFDGGEFSLNYYEKGNSVGLLSRVTTPNRLTLEYRYDETSRFLDVTVGNHYRLKPAYDSKGRLSAWNYADVGK